MQAITHACQVSSEPYKPCALNSAQSLAASLRAGGLSLLRQSGVQSGFLVSGNGRSDTCPHCLEAGSWSMRISWFDLLSQCLQTPDLQVVATTALPELLKLYAPLATILHTAQAHSNRKLKSLRLLAIGLWDSLSSLLGRRVSCLRLHSEDF